MRFSLNKIVPFLLPFFQVVSGSSIADMRTSLPSLRLVGSFSVGIEGLSAPFTFRHNIEFPLAPIGQRLLDWSDACTTTPVQPRISPSGIHDIGDTEVNSTLLLGNAAAVIQQTDPDAGAIERSGENTASTEVFFEEERQLVLRRQDSTESIVQSEDKHSAKKRKAPELELELADEWNFASKRTKLELDKQTAQGKARDPTEEISKKHKKPKKRSKSDKRCKHCRHCEEQRI